MASILRTDLDAVPSKRDWAPMILSIMVALLSLLVSAWTGYTNNDKALERRVSTVETQQKNDNQRLERIENKVDRLLERVR